MADPEQLERRLAMLLDPREASGLLVIRQRGPVIEMNAWSIARTGPTFR
ncbi:hypothetical protein [Streptomyces sp. BA2]|nr:hypothetical protein [Streptomyces sp. BA2]MWA10706.1 hypothetical protein [Streptomyces sp. BA2]